MYNRVSPFDSQIRTIKGNLSMKVISFNINGLRARLHQLQAIIDKHQPDVIGLKKSKYIMMLSLLKPLKRWVTTFFIMVKKHITV